MGSISEIFARALSSASKAYNLPTIEPPTQELFGSALFDLTALTDHISELSLFSPNETLEDISTTHLVYLLAPYATAEVRARISLKALDDPGARVPFVEQTQRYLRRYVESLHTYGIVSDEEKDLFGKDMGKVPATQRREIKIQQYRKEKELRTRIEVVRKRRRQTLSSSSSEGSESDFDLIRSLLPSPSQYQSKLDEDEDDETLRSTTLLLLRLLYTQARSQLESTAQEIELLSMAARERQSSTNEQGADDRQRGQKSAEDDMWKLDRPDPKSGPLMDEAGRPLRPFTILPSGTTAADRARLKAQVFGPDHSLPTMTIDEYLQIEQERGNIITGGGPASENAPTSSEQLALDAEMDGTLEGFEKEEQKRQKEEKWAQYTDENPKGAGNTMNRG